MILTSDVDPDPVGSGFIWVRGSGSGFGLRIQRYKITEKMKGKAKFNQQKFFFSKEIKFFKSEPKKGTFRVT